MVRLHHLLATAACVGLSTAHLTGLVPRDFDAEADVDLGILDSMDAFFHALGTNSSEWENITPTRQNETLGVLPVLNEETLARQEQNGFSGHEGTPGALSARQNDWVCDNVPDAGKFICENMPNTKVFWAFGIAYAFYYAPDVYNSWMDRAALAIYGGGWYTRYRRQGGAQGPVKRDLPFDARVIHFKLEESPSKELNTRDLEGHSAHVYAEFKYDTVTEELYSDALIASFTGPATAPAGRITSRQSTDYNILLDITKNSKDSTVAARSCISKVLKTFVDRSSRMHRHSCQQLHNSGSSMYHVGVHINHGAYNTNIPRQCC